MAKKEFKLVAEDQLPKLEDIIDTPANDLMDLFKTCQAMEKLCIASSGIGLSAVQVGLPWKLFVVQFEHGFEYFVDCEYTPLTDDKVSSVEGCLSLRDATGELERYSVSRYTSIQVKGKQLVVSTTTGEDLALIDVDRTFAKGLYCVVFQHEIEHHHAVLISQIGTKVFLWKKNILE